MATIPVPPTYPPTRFPQRKGAYTAQGDLYQLVGSLSVAQVALASLAWRGTPRPVLGEGLV